jgi:hypothetical protein
VSSAYLDIKEGREMNTETVEVTEIEGESGKYITINCEQGCGTVNVNVHVKHFGYPEWFDREVFERLVATLSGKG